MVSLNPLKPFLFTRKFLNGIEFHLLFFVPFFSPFSTSTKPPPFPNEINQNINLNNLLVPLQISGLNRRLTTCNHPLCHQISCGGRVSIKINCRRKSLYLAKFLCHHTSNTLNQRLHVSPQLQEFPPSTRGRSR